MAAPGTEAARADGFDLSQPLDLSEADGLSYRLKRCRHGRFLYNTNDMYIGRSLDLYGEYSEHEVDMLRQLVRPGHVVVEAGANIGALTVPLAQSVGHTGFVVAFEPERLISQLLGANLALNGILNVATFHAGLGAAAGHAVMPYVDHRLFNNYGAWQIMQKGAGEGVEVSTIDSLGLSRCQLIKVDVEGMELAVLEGAARTIGRFRPALFVENNPGPGSKPLIAHILSLGYRLWWHITPLYRSDNFFGNPQNVFGHAGSANMLCLHESLADHDPRLAAGERS